MQPSPGAWWRRPTVARRATNLLIVLICLGVTVLAVRGRWSPFPQPVIAAAGILGSLAQWPRRRWPHLSAIAGAAAFALSSNVAAWLVGLFAGALHSPRRQLWVPGAAGFAGFFAWSWIDTGRPTAQGLITSVVSAGLVLGAGGYLATRNALLVALQEQADHAAAERELRDEQARASERTRIAREMHDVLAHKVSLIALHAGALELRAGSDARLREGTGLIRTTARQALQELREVLGVLRVENSGPGYGESPADLAALVQASTGAGQIVELDDSVGPLPPATARVVYRTVQEGLTNAHKHAPGARATVTVNRAGEESVTVTVRNDAGAERPVELPGSGSGLIGLAERIRLVGGSLRSGPSLRDGVRVWELHAVVPWLGQPADDRADGVEAS